MVYLYACATIQSAFRDDLEEMRSHERIVVRRPQELGDELREAYVRNETSRPKLVLNRRGALTPILLELPFAVICCCCCMSNHRAYERVGGLC